MIRNFRFFPFHAISLLGILATFLQAQTATTVQLISSTNPATFGQPVTLTATVTGGSPTGKVTFYDGTAILGVSTITGSTAILTTIALPAGTRSLRAYYWGDANHLRATSATLSLPVAAGASLGLRPRPATRLWGSLLWALPRRI